MNETTNPNPTDGGSYVRDPETGALSLREPTTANPPGKSARQAEAEPEADAEDADPTPASIAGLSSRRGNRRADPTNTTPE